MAVGPDSTQLRIKTRSEPDKWVLVYSPRWDSGWLVGQRRPWPPDPLRVAWDNITHLDTRVTSPPGRGMAIGGLVGAGVAIALTTACALTDPEWSGVCTLVGLIVGVYTVPVGILVGGSLATNPRWVPVLCTDPTPQ